MSQPLPTLKFIKGRVQEFLRCHKSLFPCVQWQDPALLPAAAWSVGDGFPILPASLAAASPGSRRGKRGQEAFWSRIIHLPGLLPSAIFWSVTLWKESVSGAAGTGRQRRIAREEGGEEIRAGFFPGWKTVCPRISPKCKLNIPLSTTKLQGMGGCAASWWAGKSWTWCLSLFLHVFLCPDRNFCVCWSRSQLPFGTHLLPI